MKEFKKLLLIAFVAFICFLITFGMFFYMVGSTGSLSGLAGFIVVPLYYLILTVIALVFKHNSPVYKRPYIIMAVLSIVLPVIIWIVYICAPVIEDMTDELASALWCPIVLSVLSLIMSVFYILIVSDIIKSDRKFRII